MSTCLVMRCVCFLREWPIQLHFFLSHSASLLIVSGHHILIILLRHLFANVWIFCSTDFVIRRVSDPYIGTALTFELSMRSLVGIAISLDFHILLITTKVAFAFPTIVCTYLYVLPFVSIILPRYFILDFSLYSIWVVVLAVYLRDLGFVFVHIQSFRGCSYLHNGSRPTSPV